MNNSHKDISIRRRLNQYRVLPTLEFTDYFPTISGNSANSKVGDQDRIISFPDLASLMYDMFTRRGSGSLLKGTYTLVFSSDFPAGSKIHIDFKSTNSIGNVTNTIKITDITDSDFIVKVDADCDYTYVAHLI